VAAPDQIVVESAAPKAEPPGKPTAMTDKRLLFATVPVALEFPDEMSADIAGVLCGEYESGYFGEGVTVLDIGANVGSFTIWANMRWPHSTIHAYEPHPETFKTLVQNVGSLPNVVCHDQAVYPDAASHQMFYSRYPGDGESGLVAYIGRTFESLPQDRLVPVPTIHPRDLPRCDVVKIDVEGGEASILENMDLTGVSLILLEYQDLENRRSIERRLQPDFVCEFEDSFPWTRILPGTEYRKDLAGNSYGHLFFANKRTNRLRKLAGVESMQRSAWPVQPSGLSLRQLLTILPGAAMRALKSRLRRLF